MKLIDLTGRVFGRWIVLKRAGVNAHNHPQYLCRCECGVERNVSSCNLVRHSRSCGCLQKEKVRERLTLRPSEALYRQFIRSATHPVSMTYEQFLAFTNVTKCHYCHDKVRWDTTAYNLDRKDNLQGYSVDNCVVCCARCNRGKSNQFTYEQWVAIGKLIQTWEK